MARLPSLTALRAFEAAARHLSFSAAADELAVTPAALSFQIKGLEEALGAPLFVRRARAVELTPAGRALAPEAARGFEALRIGWMAAQRAHDTRRLTVTTGPAFTTTWLAPALGRFNAAHPDVELRIVATLAKLDFVRDGIDLAVRFGLDDDAGLFSRHFYDEHILPVMRPEMAARIDTPAALLDEILIRDESIDFLPVAPTWERWFRASGVEVSEAPHGPSFSQADHAIDAAQEGAGVALARMSVARHALRTGMVVAPFSVVFSVSARYRFVCPLGEEKRSRVQAFMSFFTHEAEQDGALLAGKDVHFLG